MKKILSLFLAIIIMVGVCLSVGIVVNAESQNIQFDHVYSYQYTNDKNCKGEFSIPVEGVVKFGVVLPTDTYGSDCMVYFLVSNNALNVNIEKSIYKDGNYYMFLKAGTYSYNISLGEYYTPVDEMQYVFSFTENSNDKTITAIYDKTYTHYYNTQNCYTYFNLNEASTVTMYLTLPAKATDFSDKISAYIKIYDTNKNNKEIINEFFVYSGDFAYEYTVRLPKGRYKLNYCCPSIYLSSDCIDERELVTCAYKIFTKKASTPKTPKLTQKVKTKKYSYFTEYSVTASFGDNQAYDGVELWIKEDNGKWKLHQTVKNSDYLRYKKVYLSIYDNNNYVVFYKVRAYSLYGNQKVYSNFSNTLCTKTSLKPKSPSITVKSSKKKTATISWKKLNSVDGYTVYCSTKKNSGYKKVTTIKKSSTKSYTNKNLKSKKTYYYKVRSFKKVNNETIYSNYSSVKKVKVK